MRVRVKAKGPKDRVRVRCLCEGVWPALVLMQVLVLRVGVENRAWVRGPVLVLVL